MSGFDIHLIGVSEEDNRLVDGEALIRERNNGWELLRFEKKHDSPVEVHSKY